MLVSGAAACLVLASSPDSVTAQDPVPPPDKPGHHFLNLTIAYPLGTNQDPDITTNVRLSLIFGRVGAVHGIDINWGVSLIHRDLKGIQVNGLYSQVGGDFRGAVFTFGVNNFYGDGKGAQVAGLVNFHQDSFAGVQYANLFNYTEDSFRGVQATSLFNLNDGSGGYVQVAGVANANAGDFTGVQLTAFFNYTNGTCRGVQLGNLNTAANLRGVQFGLANIAEDVRGLQVGVVNLAGQQDGWPIGVVNLAGNSDEDWVSFASSLAAFNTGLRTTVNRWYSMVTVGAGDLQQDQSDTVFLSWHYGRVFPLGSRWSLNADLGFINIMPAASDDPEVNDDMRPAAQVRLLLEVRLGSKVKLFGGIGINSVASSYSDDATAEDDGLYTLGLSLF